MKCKKVKKLLPAYIEGLLRSKTHQHVSEHLSLCSDCAAEEEETRKAITLASSLKVRYPSDYKWEGFLDDLHRRIEQEALLQTVRRPLSDRLIPIAGVAAMLLLFLMTVGVLHLGIIKPESQPSSVTLETGDELNIEPLLANLMGDVKIEKLSDLQGIDYMSNVPEDVLVLDDIDSVATEVSNSPKNIMDIFGPELWEFADQDVAFVSY